MRPVFLLILASLIALVVLAALAWFLSPTTISAIPGLDLNARTADDQSTRERLGILSREIESVQRELEQFRRNGHDHGDSRFPTNDHTHYADHEHSMYGYPSLDGSSHTHSEFHSHGYGD